jgi:hypothetical protein
MESNITGLILGILMISLLAILVTLVGAYLSLMMRRSCPHCRTMISRKATTCPHCRTVMVQVT